MNNTEDNYRDPGTPPRRGGSPPARRSSRSRSPKRNGAGPKPDADGTTNPGNNLHVSGLHNEVDSRELEAVFGKIGKVKKASVMYDPHSRVSRGFGFVTMDNPEDAEKAVSQLNATEHMGKTMTVQKARRGRARTPTPGSYHGPPKPRADYHERQYDPRPFDSRYHDDRRERDRDRDRYRYDDRRPRYDDRRYDDRRYDDRRYEDRRYDDRKY